MESLQQTHCHKLSVSLFTDQIAPGNLIQSLKNKTENWLLKHGHKSNRILQIN